MRSATSTLAAVVDAQLADPPAHARVVVCTRTFPTGALGYWVRRLAEGGLVRGDRDLAAAALVAGRRAARRHESARDRVPSSDGKPVVADVSMGRSPTGTCLPRGRA